MRSIGVRQRLASCCRLSTADSGYTILEVLLFVAMSAVLLVIAVSNISGNQSEIQFSQGIREFDSRLSDIINDVPTGYYTSSDNLACTAGVSGRPQVVDGVSSGFGMNEDCIYVGKGIQFTEGSTFSVATLVGRRYAPNSIATTQLANTIDEVIPVVLATVADTSAVSEVTLQNGIRVRKVMNGDVNTTVYGSVGLLANFEGSIAGASATSQAVRVGGITGTALDDSPGQAAFAMNSLTDTAGNFGGFAPLTAGVVICLIDDSNRKASLTIGASGSAGTVLDIDNYNVGCDLP